MKKQTNKKDKEEVIDFSVLPKINIVTNLIIPNFKQHPLNQERRFKILENLFKSQHKIVKFIAKEQIIEYAKEKEIFKESEQRKEISKEELSKAASLLIQDKGVPAMKEKKALIDLIAERKKQKEDATIAWANAQNQPIDPKKKVDPKAPKLVNPDDIQIPVLDESATEMVIVLYNFPLSDEEYYEFCKFLPVNTVTLINDMV
jgi:hypothetical protein